MTLVKLVILSVCVIDCKMRSFKFPKSLPISKVFSQCRCVLGNCAFFLCSPATASRHIWHRL